MRQIHNFTTKHWRVLLLVFLILSTVFALLNAKFSAEAEKGCFEDVPVARLNSQAFTSSINFRALDTATWQQFTNCYAANQKAKTLNAAIFLIDDVWAVFFIAMIYLLGNIKNFLFTPTKKVLLLVLLIAYTFDFVENAIYLTLTEVIVLPTIGTVKILFYVAGILLSLAILGRHLISRKKQAG